MAPLKLTIYAAVAVLASASIVVNEVATSGNPNDFCADEDYVELYNPTSAAVSLTGLILTDDHGLPYDGALTMGGSGCATSMPAGSYLLLCKDSSATLFDGAGSVLSAVATGCSIGFGMGGSDVASLYAADATTLISTSTISSPTSTADTSWGLATVDGTGSYVSTLRTPGAPNAFLVINEIATSGNANDACAGDDWIELWNPSSADVTLTGMQLSDDHGLPYSSSFTLGQGSCPTTLAAGELMLLCKDGAAIVGSTSSAGCGFGFGMGGTDMASLYDAAGTMISSSGAASGGGSSTVTWGRDPTAATSPSTFYEMAPTPGAANNAPAAASNPSPPVAPPYFVPTVVVINEVADKEDPLDACAGVDWIELYNPTASPETIAGLVLVDDKGHGDSDQLILGQGACPTVLGGGEYLLLCKDGKASIGSTDYDGCGFGFGIGSGDTIQLFVNATHEHYLDQTPGCCANSNVASYGLASVDGTGAHTVLNVRTPGVQNVWTVMINEVATSGNANDFCADEDYIELYNPLTTAVDLTGMILTDDHGLPYSSSLTLGQGSCPTTLAAGAYFVMCKEAAGKVVDGATETPTDASCSFTFGMGGSDQVFLYMADAQTIIDTSGNLGGLGSSIQSQGRANPSTGFVTMARTPGAPNIDLSSVPTPPPSPSLPPATFPPLAPNPIKISEVAATGNNDDICAGADWIELWNPTEEAASLVGMILVDDKGHGHSDRLALGAAGCPQTLNADEYVLYCKAPGSAYIGATAYANCGFAYGVGDGDTINLYVNATHDILVDTTPHCCTDQMTNSFCRTTHDGTGAFHVCETRTPGTQNYMDPPPPASPSPPPSAVTVTTSFIAAGVVSDYPQSVQTSMAAVFAAEAGVPASAVTLSVASGSVVISVVIRVATPTQAALVSTGLETGLMASASSLSTAMASAGIAVTVSAVTAPAWSDGTTAAADDDSDLMTIIVILSVVAAIAIAVAIWALNNKAQKRPLFFPITKPFEPPTQGTKSSTEMASKAKEEAKV